MHDPPVFDFKNYLRSWPVTTSGIHLEIDTSNSKTPKRISNLSTDDRPKPRSALEVSDSLRKKSKAAEENKNRNARESRVSRRSGILLQEYIIAVELCYFDKNKVKSLMA